MRSPETKKGFTLIELLVVISIISILMGILLPVLSKAKSEAKEIVCASNLRQLVFANTSYTMDNDGYYVRGAPDFTKNLHRWHGVREDIDEPFDPEKGPLWPYYQDGELKECPHKWKYRDIDDWNLNYEQGCGGYGYNMLYLGSRLWTAGGSVSDIYNKSTRASWVSQPDETLMFADTAMADGNAEDASLYMEYSFAEPRHYLIRGKITDKYEPSPSIHFRHDGLANVGWCDGHVSSEKLAPQKGKNYRGVESSDMKLGWFKPVNNSRFDLE